MRGKNIYISVSYTHLDVYKRQVKGMLPKGPLGRSMIKKLHVYAGPDHEQQDVYKRQA